MIAVSFMVKYGARRTFPCFDEPDFKAEFDITLEHPDDYNATSNMPIKQQRVKLQQFILSL